MITTEHELGEAVATAGALLQDISDYANAHPQNLHNVRVRFPRGFLRTNYEARQSFAFVEDQTLRSNISYAIMAHDVLRWLIQRTDLSGQAKEMVIKEGVCLIASICESLTIIRNERGLGRNGGYERRVRRLNELKIIDDAGLADLLWLWKKRSNEHLFLVEIKEFSHYRMDDWLRSLRAYRALKGGLAQWHVKKS